MDSRLDQIKAKRKAGKKIILLIDDENVITEILKSELDSVMSDHFHIETYTNSISAFRHIKEVEPVLVISDIIMPDIDGLEIEKLCNKMGIPCLLMTGANITNRPYIPKPIHMDVLVHKISRLVDIDQIETTEYEYIEFLEYLRKRLENW